MGYDIPAVTPLRVNFGTAPRVEYEWRTGIFQSRKGTEQRWAERQSPRISIEFEHLGLQGLAETNRVRAWLERCQGDAVAIPDFRAITRVTGRAGDAFTTARDAGLFVDQLVMLIGAPDDTQRVCARVLEVDGDMVRLTPEPPPGYEAGCLLFTCVTGMLAEEITATRLTGTVDRIAVKSANLPGMDPIAPYVEAATTTPRGNLVGVEVFPLRHNWASGLEVGYSRRRSSVDYGIGRIYSEPLEILGRRSATIQHQTFDYAEARALVDFAHRVEGRLRPFTAFGSDFEMPMPTAVTSHVVDNQLCFALVIPGAEDLLQPDFSAFPQGLLVHLQGGPVAHLVRHYPRADSPGGAGLYRMLDVWHPNGYSVGYQYQVLKLEDITRVERTPLWRMASDKLTLSVLSDQFISCKLELHELIENRG